MQPARRQMIWFIAYLAVVLSSLAPALSVETTRAPWSVEFSAALALSAYAMLAVQFALIGRSQRLTRALGIDAMMRFHAQAGVAGAVVVSAHILSAAPVVDVLAMLNPFSTSAAKWGALAWWALVSLIATSLMRARIGYERWQLLHMAMAVLVIVASWLHARTLGRYAPTMPVALILGAQGAIAIACLVAYRIVRPLRLWRRPWRVIANRDEGGDTRTLCLAAQGHEGLQFEAGQFVWLSTATHPFAIEQHPISIASSAMHAATLELSIKALGDWSRNIVPRIQPGERVWIDGAYGSLGSETDGAGPLVLICGGVGVTPMRSILLTMRDRGVRRSVMLLYGASSPARMIFTEELKRLAGELNLTCVFVYESPPDDWPGERGLIDTALLRRHLPSDTAECDCVVCGPEAMMTSVEQSLLRLGVDRRRIRTERFVWS